MVVNNKNGTPFFSRRYSLSCFFVLFFFPGTRALGSPLWTSKQLQCRCKGDPPATKGSFSQHRLDGAAVIGSF